MTQPLAPPTFFERLVGVKGASLVPVKGSRKEKESAGTESPVARLKLLLIASFTTLHILNLITPLAPSYVHGHHSTPAKTLSMTSSGAIMDGSAVGVRRVDIMESGVSDALDALALAVGKQTGEDAYANGEHLLVKVFPPIWARVVPSPALVASASAKARTQAIPRLERFMSSWTRLVGDPILSKWIVVVLAISISLNGYLLKGIAAGLGLGLGLVRKESDGVRFSDGEGEPRGVIKVKDEKFDDSRGQRRVEGRLASAVPTFTLDDVDRQLELKVKAAARKRRDTVTPATSPVVSSRPVHLPTPPSHPLAGGLPMERPDLDTPVNEVHVRSLKECLEIYEHGPRPASDALEMLNDEEVILLAQAGKIAAYALEKVLGSDRLERAVRVRRALICEFYF